jgi:hypothetical protein
MWISEKVPELELELELVEKLQASMANKSRAPASQGEFSFISKFLLN